MMPLDQLSASLKEPPLREIAVYWGRARAGRRLPSWRDIDPIALAPHLPILWAWRWDKALDTFVGRLAGEAILDVTGPGFRGRRLEDFFADRGPEIVKSRYRRVIEEPALMRNHGFVFLRSGGSGIGERIALPLAEDGEHPDGVLGATVYYPSGHLLARARISFSSEPQSVEFFSL